MVFSRNYLIRTKTVINYIPLEQVLYFQYLGCNITYEEDIDRNYNINKYQCIYGTIKSIFQNKTLKEMQLKFYKAAQIHTLLSDSVCCVFKKGVSHTTEIV